MKLNESAFDEEILYELEPDEDINIEETPGVFILEIPDEQNEDGIVTDDIQMDVDLGDAQDELTNNGLASIIRDLIADEWEAVDGYKSAMLNCGAVGRQDIKAAFEDIMKEEMVHIGELERIMKEVAPEVDEIQSGYSEVEGVL